MAEVENLNSVPASEDTEYGFKRPEMYSTNIANSITSYDRHVFVLYKTPEAWLSHVEEEGLPQRFATLLKDRKSDLLFQVYKNVEHVFTYGLSLSSDERFFLSHYADFFLVSFVVVVDEA